MYGHIKQLADAEKAGIEKAGGTADIYQFPETLPKEVLSKMHAPSQDASVAILDDPAKLQDYDAFLFGIPTRYGNFPAQWKVIIDRQVSTWRGLKKEKRKTRNTNVYLGRASGTLPVLYGAQEATGVRRLDSSSLPAL